MKRQSSDIILGLHSISDWFYCILRYNILFPKDSQTEMFLTASYLFFSSAANFSNLDLSDTCSQRLPSSLAISPTVQPGCLALTFGLSSLQNMKKADLK